ncbi:hypothetical protein H6G45_06380 [Synechocystis sp. FACHB-383]|uniref:hypothetical protein n=1 Tax=Synechocystis sp. FACHB-383 TaxID=2692864 RepID=UPI001689348C|nr:hypothetical protein [Synechocystis sp. FACHB-383]MBD2653119.1 hypothetical protein [Synechocystis sp. FACHB-383]
MLTDRPKYPDRRPELVKTHIASRYGGFTVYFLPDNLKFGRWTNLAEAEEALKIWEKNFTCQPVEPWQKYCQSRGYKSVSWV